MVKRPRVCLKCVSGQARLAELNERTLREEQEAVQRRRDWADRQDSEAKERSAAKVVEIREWRARQRGEYTVDPKFGDKHEVHGDHSYMCIMMQSMHMITYVTIHY